MIPYGIMGFVNSGSSNGLLPDGTKPLPELMLVDSLSIGLKKNPCEILI